MAIKRESEETYSLRQIAFAVGTEAGRPVTVIAKALGMTARWGYELHARDQKKIDEIRAAIREFVKPQNVKELEKLTLEKFREELEGDLALYVQAIRKAANDEDAKTALAGAMAGLGYAVGKPKQTMEVTGGTKNRVDHVFSLSTETLAALSGAVSQSLPLHQAARQIEGAIDVRPIQGGHTA